MFTVILTVIIVSLVEVAMFTVILTVIIVSLVGVPMFTVIPTVITVSLVEVAMFSHFNRHYSVFGGGPFVYSQSFQRSLQCLWWRSPCLVILTVIIVSLVGVPLFTVSHSNGHYSVFGGGRHV